MNLLPSSAEPYSLQNVGKVYWVSPIHFHEKCLGYCVIQGCDYPLINPMFRTWISNVSTTVENLRNKTSLKNVIHELDKLYVIDNLSKIYNRNGFSRATENIYQDACQNKDDIMVLFIDLDGLKYINDKFGHKEGDNAIIEVANVIKKCCTHGEVFARFGGDEFVVFSSNYDSIQVEILCENINEEFQRYNAKSGKAYNIGASMGYHITTADSNISINNIINIADAKMYELKKRHNKARGQKV
jgi:diguanylate cyclase (GGDEF)-like protein